MTPQNDNYLGRQAIVALPKVLLHEHLDCSLRTATMLELFQEASWPVPANFPANVRQQFETGARAEAAIAYQQFLADEASLSLANYVTAIVHHVLPLMQTEAQLTRITRERIEDAVADGIFALELRFAPQLHTGAGLSLEQVMDAVIAGMDAASIPVRLTVCALRHEKQQMARRLADLVIDYKDFVGMYDLAGDEKAKPGVLLWWAQEAVRVREHGIDIECHLWETDEPCDEDLVRLAEFSIKRLGHGMRGNRQEDRILEVCPSSNVVTGQIKSIAEHPIDRLYRQGKKVTINTDGTLFTRSDLSNEYLLLHKTFGWGKQEFLATNLTATEASCFPDDVKSKLRTRLENEYRQ